MILEIVLIGKEINFERKPSFLLLLIIIIIIACWAAAIKGLALKGPIPQMKFPYKA